MSTFDELALSLLGKGTADQDKMRSDRLYAEINTDSCGPGLIWPLACTLLTFHFSFIGEGLSHKCFSNYIKGEMCL